MSMTLTWPEIALRLALAGLAGGLIGLNRGEHDRRAGLRTNLLVLGGCVEHDPDGSAPAYLGQDDASFVVMDVMRLPLGILSGMASSVPEPSCAGASSFWG
jgi:putative Mg2+ transporter-C (MgtC) family protein